MPGASSRRVAASVGVVWLGIGTLVAPSGCRRAETPPVRVTFSDGVELQFRPQAAYAEYLELPGLRNELRITLASYPASCQRYQRPGVDDTLVSITLLLPPEVAPEVTQYPSLSAATARDAVTKIEQATASVYVRHGSKDYSFRPGGVLNLTRLKLGPHGQIAGETAFESPPDSSQPMMRLDGKFSADMCRYQSTTE